MSQWNELRGRLSPSLDLTIAATGFAVIVVLWQTICVVGNVSPAILPSPWSVLKAIPELHFEDALVRNTLYSIKLNLLGYGQAIAIAIPLGLAIGLQPVLRALALRYVNAVRFVPLTAVTGLFIAWFGIDELMRVQFLAFGILVYLLPVVIQRVDETLEVYVQTVKTLGASRWQTVRRVFIPSVTSAISDDARVLVAISWTYIIVAEVVNMSKGVGALAFMSARQSRIDKVFAVLLVIVAVGFVQDRVFQWLDRQLFPYKRA